MAGFAMTMRNWSYEFLRICARLYVNGIALLSSTVSSQQHWILQILLWETTNVEGTLQSHTLWRRFSQQWKNLRYLKSQISHQSRHSSTQTVFQLCWTIRIQCRRMIQKKVAYHYHDHTCSQNHTLLNSWFVVLIC